MEIQENIPLAPLTTFKIGGNARYFARVTTDHELHEALMWAQEQGVQHAIIAGGSNMLIPDDGFDGLVIQLAQPHFSFAHTQLRADAGCNLLHLIETAAKKKLGGWEKLAGIPGTIGGAVRGNAGAFGTEIKDVLDEVTALNIETGEVKRFKNAECAFAYRRSFFKFNPQWIITHVYLTLHRVDATESKALIADTIVEREKRHLQNVQAAGSYFMNPPAPRHVIEEFEQEKNTTAREGRVPAGWLIEKVGMKGATVGGAIASQQHPNYLTNAGDATAADVLELATQIKLAVHQKYGITLQEEAAIL